MWFFYCRSEKSKVLPEQKFIEGINRPEISLVTSIQTLVIVSYNFIFEMIENVIYIIITI